MTVNFSSDYHKLIHDNRERVKELTCINKTVSIIRENRPVAETLRRVVNFLPPAWQYPENTVARIVFDNMEFTSPAFIETEWRQAKDFASADGKRGVIEVYYTCRFEDIDEGPFLKEERDLIDNIALILASYINTYNTIENLRLEDRPDTEDREQKNISRQLIQWFINKHNYDRDVYHDLMPYKVKEIMFVSNLYDAYSIEKEGRFTEHILGEYHQMNLASTPRITGVSFYDEIVPNLRKKNYDIIIVMMGSDKKLPFSILELIRSESPYLPVFLLLNNSYDIEVVEKYEGKVNFDNVFIWNGDSKIFFAMIKMLEDRMNIDNDVARALVPVILMVEDSPKYYSRVLPALYSIIMEQTRRQIEDVNADELFKVLRLRARPKVIHAKSLEQAKEYIDKYSATLLCVITDVGYPSEGKLDEDAGFKLIDYIRKFRLNIPVLVQSGDQRNHARAYEIKAQYINKFSETYLQDIRSFISFFIGFNQFTFRSGKGVKIAEARNLKEFEKLMAEVPEDSILYHHERNQFSLWMLAKGEIQTSKAISGLSKHSEISAEEIRQSILHSIRRYRVAKDKGRIVNFEESALKDESNIVSLASGALGGKGRGLAFVNTLIYHFNINDMIEGIQIRTPLTSIIGTDEFDFFMERNKLHEVIHNETDYQVLRAGFVKGELSFNLAKRLKVLIKHLRKPLAIRSSSLFEDSLSQPFSGVFETYMLPNNHPDDSVRLQQLMTAIKLVYSSVYSNNARTYFEAIGHKVEEEKMAVVIQEVVGNQYAQSFYPHISGTAQSHNYYPVGHMKPDEGFGVLALGLGQYVVEGEKTYRFSPQYPKIDIQSLKDTVKNSQVHFYAVNLANPDVDLISGEDAGVSRLDLFEAEQHGTLKHLASTYDPQNETLEAGISKPGPRIINFANIMKYEYTPLAKTVGFILDLVKEAMGSPVEIEYAVDLNKDENGHCSFYLLQIKPLVGGDQDFRIDTEKLDMNQALLFSQKTMGNGTVGEIYDVVYVLPEKFDHTRTEEMTAEIEKINLRMLAEKRKYILIGPGRWGTRDKFIGIPVVWSQISNAKVIVEVSLKDFPLDASLGSHFFHNVTSMNVGYFSIDYYSQTEFIRWELMAGMPAVEETSFFRHVRFDQPLTVLMDGKQRISVIMQERKTFD